MIEPSYLSPCQDNHPKSPVPSTLCWGDAVRHLHLCTRHAHVTQHNHGGRLRSLDQCDGQTSPPAAPPTLPPSALMSRGEVERMLTAAQEQVRAAMDKIRAECRGILHSENPYQRAHRIIAIADSVAKEKKETT